MGAPGGQDESSAGGGTGTDRAGALETKGNQVQAAKLLGITRATLRKRVDKFKIKQELAVE